MLRLASPAAAHSAEAVEPGEMIREAQREVGNETTLFKDA